MNRKYWTSLEEFIDNKCARSQSDVNDYSSEKEKGFNLKSNRRDFLKYSGYGISLATLVSACKRNPLNRFRPFFPNKNQLQPVTTKWYATTCQACSSTCPFQVKVIDNKAIKIEGNSNSIMTNGGVCAFGHASLLELFSKKRLKYPMVKGNKTDWNIIDNDIITKLKSISDKKGKIVILSTTINSPSTNKLIKEFSSYYGIVEHISFDPISSYGILKANENCFGKKIIPNYKFDKARLIVSFGADFLNNWISPIEYTGKYLKTRDIDRHKKMSYHIQFESLLSLTGSNADQRIAIKPSEEGPLLISLYNNIAKLASKAVLPNTDYNKHQELLERLAKKLWEEKGRSVVISGSNNTSIQMIINGINSLLENYGRTIDIDNPSFQKQGDDPAITHLVDQMNNGLIEGLIIYNTNPAYNYFEASKFIEGLKKVPLTISISDKSNETSELVIYVCPDIHFLESWNDHQPKHGQYSLSQPVVRHVENARSVQESLLIWMGKPSSYFDYLRSYWKEYLFPKQKKFLDFESFWQNSVHQGVFTIPNKRVKKYNFNLYLKSHAQNIIKDCKNNLNTELILFENNAVRNGSQGDNAVLNELPDPISKVCWENYASVSPGFSLRNNIRDEDVIEIKCSEYSLSLPVIIQPGQSDATVGLALGYGQNNGIGANVYPFISYINDSYNYNNQSIQISKTGRKSSLARTQTHHRIKGADVVKDFTVAEYLNTPLKTESSDSALIKRRFYPHHWAMVIDLNACTGCNACVISCQIENNVPVIGKDQVHKKREMHWIRIDRYYEGDDPNNVKVHFQPIICQQCDNAPCEAVCPVGATTNSSEGLNQQSYQRCIGTRFCATNCPYNVRRFNYFQYADEIKYNPHLVNESGQISLNPEVSRREMGVIEKCSFCIQRIQEGKAKAKNANKSLQDGEIKTACEQSCPGKAIIFGDINDRSSRVYRLIKNKRAFQVLPELNTSPSVHFLAKVRNNNEF